MENYVDVVLRQALKGTGQAKVLIKIIIPVLQSLKTLVRVNILKNNCLKC